MSGDFVFERSVVIHASVDVVFAHFTDSARFAAWWGEGSTIEPEVGGKVLIRYPNGVVALGEVQEIDVPRRIVFTFGYESGEPIPAGGSEVRMEVHEVEEGARVDLVHRCSTRDIRDAHVLGWRYHLGAFAKVASEVHCANLAELNDRYFAAWSETDVEKRLALLESCTTEDVTFRDLYGCTLDRQELSDHITAAQQHMKGVLSRRGAPRHCHGTAIVPWKATMPDGSEGGGENVVTLAPDGRMRTIIGVWCE